MKPAWVLGCVMLAGCVAPIASRQAERTARANWKHAANMEIAPTAREVGRVNAVAWEVQFFVLEGEWRTDTARDEVLRAFGARSEDELLNMIEAGK